MRHLLAAVLLASTLLSTASAQAPATRSRPAAQPLVSRVPVARDIPSPGTMQLAVDATDVGRRIFRVKQTIPVAGPGPMTLLYPEWLPGNHAPRGQLDKLAGLKFTAEGRTLDWVRDPLNVYAFHISVPAGARAVVAEFQFLSPTSPAQGRVQMTSSMLSLQWEDVSLYPAGHFVRQIPVQASVTYPDGWQAATALRGTKSGDTVRYEVTDYEVLVDSPVLAGRNFRSWDLGRDVRLDVVADTNAELRATDDQIAAHRKLVDEAIALFGARHYDRYTFLLSITDELGGIGLEHHRSSENGVESGYFTKWNEGPGSRNLLPHEFVHSWDGKFRRPDLLWTPTYAVPMQDNLLWVYEGQTQFWGYVLGARSGLYTKEQTLDALAQIAARFDLFVGRSWRPLEDTAHDPIIAARRPKAWLSWQRSEDYYNEGLLIWLEADGIIRRETRGARGMDDFARAFFGINDGDWGQVTYNRQDVIDTLNRVAPYDWTKFIADRVDDPTPEAPKNGLTLGGYRLVFDTVPSSASRSYESGIKGTDQSYGIGIVARNDGEIISVIWDSPAFKAGLTVGMKFLAVRGQEFNGERFKAAIGRKEPVDLIVKDGSAIRNIRIDYSGGLRYPRLAKTGEGEGSLDLLLKPKT